MTNYWVYISIIIGSISGFLAGLLGIGGAVIMIPSMVYFLNFQQQTAQGTALAAMLLPVGLLAVIEYHKNGYINVKVGLLIAFTFFIGSFFGAKLAQNIDGLILKRIFASLLILVSLKMLIS